MKKIARLFALILVFSFLLMPVQATDYSPYWREDPPQLEEYAFTFASTVHFIPVFMNDMKSIMEAQTARGVEFDVGGIAQKTVLGVELNFRIDRFDAFCPDIGFGTSCRRGQGGNLPVAVGYIHQVTVDDGEFSDPGAGEIFHGIAADAADAEDENMGSCKFPAVVFTDKQRGAVKEEIIIFHRKQTP